MKKIAVICNYELLPERVGGMDRFFWLFNKQCLQLNYQIDWFFPAVTLFYLLMQADGNVVAYDGNNNPAPSNPK